MVTILALLSWRSVHAILAAISARPWGFGVVLGLFKTADILVDASTRHARTLCHAPQAATCGWRMVIVAVASGWRTGHLAMGVELRCCVRVDGIRPVQRLIGKRISGGLT